MVSSMLCRMLETDLTSNHSIKTLSHALPKLSNRIQPTTVYTAHALLALRLYFLLNLFIAFLPLVRSRTNGPITDIPLTPSQRALMGLPPSPSPSKRTPNAAASRTPGSNGNSSTAFSPAYVTPPRYKRVSYSPSPSANGSNAALGPPTPGSGRSISANYSSSPLSGRGSSPFSPDSTFRSLNTSINRPPNSPSPFSPTPRSTSGSPLLQKALASNNNHRDTDAAFRSSFANPSTPGSGLRRSQSVRETGVGGIGSGSGSGRRSPGVNYKWLYEKEKRGQTRGFGGIGGVIDGGAGGERGRGLLARSESIQF
jgi:Nuclear pore complex component